MSEAKNVREKTMLYLEGGEKKKGKKKGISIILNILSIILRADDSSSSFSLKARFANETELLAQETVD